VRSTSLARLLSRLLTVVVLVVSGCYLLVYLYRWEWNRALISGLFFLAAEVAFVGSTIRADIRALVTRSDALEATAQRRLHAALGAPDARPARPFRWLEETAENGTGVFVPVLLGAGVILSALAFVVERVAGVVAHSTMDRSSARRLVDLEPPAHGLLATRPAAATAPARPARRATAASRAVALTMLALLVVAAVEVLADATQTRPSAADPGVTVVELRVAQRRTDRPVIEAAEALVVACNGALPAGAEVTDVTALENGRVRLDVTTRLGEPRRRRFFGCLEDATLDLVGAKVVGWTHLNDG
jgi:hypothetical protein